YFLSMMMLVGVIGLSAVTVTRVQLRTAEGSNDASAARLYAQSAIELGMAMVQQDSNWRTTLGSGVWFTDQPIGAGTMTLESTIISDADANPENDPVVLIGTGVHGQATHKVEVTLTALSDRGGLAIASGSWKRNTG
ncbi:MAG: hypothetical protein GY778_05585, partial [bacterium]|nr:hypothetical protein [bacterium]